MATQTEKNIRKFALANAYSHGGKAQSGSIIGQLIAEDSRIKSQLKDINPIIQKIIKEVNKLSVKEQEAELKKIYPEFFEKKEIKEKTLPDLKNAEKGKVVMRFEPSPSGPLHIGHAYTLSLNSEFCKKYNGKLILRIADTDAKKIDPVSYDLIPEDGNWITKNNVAKVVVQSDNLKSYYKHAEKAISKGAAYVCTCDSEEFRKLLIKSKACPCRELGPSVHMKRWKDMFNSKAYKQGDAVLRIKTDLEHKNPAMRDWPAIRISDVKHPKQGTKYRVWPLMNFAVAIDDYENGVTHAIRAKEHRDNELRQKYLYHHFGWTMPSHLYVGRINFRGLRVSASQTKQLIDQGKYAGWDDPRLPFLQALSKRGYQPEAFIRYATEVGVSENDKTVHGDEFFKTIDKFNRDALEEKTNRYFLAAQPIYLKIEDAKKNKAKLDLHPNYPKRGKREINIDSEFYVSRKDAEKLKKGDVIRLKDLHKIEIVSTKGTKNNPLMLTAKLTKDQKLDPKTLKIEWVPKNSNIGTEVYMPDGSVILGFAEKSTDLLKVGDVIQFQRFGFCRLDKKNKDKLIFYYAHK